MGLLTFVLFIVYWIWKFWPTTNDFGAEITNDTSSAKAVTENKIIPIIAKNTLFISKTEILCEYSINRRKISVFHRSTNELILFLPIFF